MTANQRAIEALRTIVALALVDKSCFLEAQGLSELEIERHSWHCDAAEIAREALAALEAEEVNQVASVPVTKDQWWCDDCECFVDDENHRCQQWSTMWKIPFKAIHAILTPSPTVPVTKIRLLEEALRHIRDTLEYYLPNKQSRSLECRFTIESIDKEIVDALITAQSKHVEEDPGIEAIVKVLRNNDATWGDFAKAFKARFNEIDTEEMWRQLGESYGFTQAKPVEVDRDTVKKLAHEKMLNYVDMGHFRDHEFALKLLKEGYEFGYLDALQSASVRVKP